MDNINSATDLNYSRPNPEVSPSLSSCLDQAKVRKETMTVQ
jgi:hypothetical protein